MQTQYLIRSEAPQVPPYDAAQMAQGMGAQLAHFLLPLLVQLDGLLDKRLVRTFRASHRSHHHQTLPCSWLAALGIGCLSGDAGQSPSRHQTLK